MFSFAASCALLKGVGHCSIVILFFGGETSLIFTGANSISVYWFDGYKLDGTFGLWDFLYFLPL